MDVLPGPEEVLSFWFGPLDPGGHADLAHRQRWWAKDPELDREITERFGALHAEVAAGRRESWLSSPRGRLAYVIVLDQLSRNMFRGTPRMFSSDAQALEAAKEGIRLGEDRTLPIDLRTFFYLPLMHSESLEDQERCVALFEALRNELTGEAKEMITFNLRFAVQHRDIVARFGRFPHRNAVLGRASTEEEQAFLEQPGSSF